MGVVWYINFTISPTCILLVWVCVITDRSESINACFFGDRGDKSTLALTYVHSGNTILGDVSYVFVNTLRPRQNGRHFPDDIFKWIFLNENVWISINISLKFVPKGPINNNPTLVQVMAWRRPGDKPLSEPMMVRLPTRICVTRPQWV